MKIFAGFPSHGDYKTITITTNPKEVRRFEYKEEVEVSPYLFINWDDEEVEVVPYSSLETLINEISMGFYDFVGSEEIDEKEYDYEIEKLTKEGLKQAWALLKKYTNDSEPDGDSSAGCLILKNTTIIAGNSDYYNAGEGITVKNEIVTENKEKQLTIELLTEKLQRISGKKIMLEKTNKNIDIKDFYNLNKKEKIVVSYFLNNLANDRREYDVEDLIKSGVPKNYAKWIFEQLNDNDNFVYYEAISKIIKLVERKKINKEEAIEYLKEFESNFDTEAY